MRVPIFCPKLQKIEYTGGSFEAFITGTDLKELPITYCKKQSLKPEAYEIDICPSKITVTHYDAAGAFYARATLAQLLAQCADSLPCCHIEDFPQLKIRGVLIDISRGKVPKLSELFRLADLLSSVKINHLELYIEGFSFAYPSFPGVWQKESCLTPEELKKFSDYCKERFINLVPHQNSLGHMAPWLARAEFKSLAEAPEGLEVMGMKFPPTTLDAVDAKSLALVKTMISDLCPSFEKGLFHVGLDEAFEFCKGKNKAAAEKDEAWTIVFTYIKALYDFLLEKGFHIMIWDDFLMKYPMLFERLPKDILICDWGYDAEFPVEERAAQFRRSGRPFCLCPGTSSWSSFTGLTDNMLENNRRTGAAAHKYGAEGLIITDWGDMNHFQYTPVSYAGFLCGAAWGWSADGISEDDLKAALNCFVFKDNKNVMGDFCFKAGRFYKQEEFRMPCRSLACLPLIFGRRPKAEYTAMVERLAKSVTFFSPEAVCNACLGSYENRTAFEGDKMYAYLTDCRKMLKCASMTCEDGALIIREYENALNMLEYLTRVRESIENENGTESENGFLDKILKEHAALWHARNKESGLMAGIGMFERLRI